MEDPAVGGYSCLKPGAMFKSLMKVPLVTGESTDLSRFPARRGFEDLVQVFADPRSRFAWTAVTFPKERYVWFALRDPRVLTGTILWLSNGGRHYAPWNGRHTNVMGLEDVTTYFHEGIAESAAANLASKAGCTTSIKLTPNRKLIVDYLIAVVAIPKTFRHVRTITLKDGVATLIDCLDHVVSTPVGEIADSPTSVHPSTPRAAARIAMAGCRRAGATSSARRYCQIPS